MKRTLALAWKGVRRMVWLYLLYCFIGSTAPWLPFVRPVGDGGQMAQAAREAPFTGDGEGSDRALLIETPQDAFNIRLQMLQAAENTLDIVYYSIAADECGQAFLGEVLRAADRGVSVRILVDGKMNTGKIRELLGQLETHENIACRQYNPSHFLQPWKWHAALHDKFILADGQYLLLGGRNISNRFFAPAAHAGEVTQDRDVFVAATGDPQKSVCAQARGYMDLLWDAEAQVAYKPAQNAAEALSSLRGGAEALRADNPAFFEKTFADYLAATVPTRNITLVTNPIHTGRKEPLVAQAMRRLALDASSSVVIQTPYATASAILMDALSEIDANADTTLLTNSLASSPNYIAFSNYYTQRQRFLDAGLDIYELQSTDSIHGKSMIVDHHLSAVGSFNMDDRSFYIDTESMLIIDSAPFAQSLQRAVDEYLGASLRVGADNRYLPQDAVAALPVPLGKRAMMGVVSVFSRLFSFLV